MSNYLGIPKGKEKAQAKEQPSSVVGHVAKLVEDCGFWVQLKPQSATIAGQQRYQAEIDFADFAVADLLDYQRSF